MSQGRSFGRECGRDFSHFLFSCARARKWGRGGRALKFKLRFQNGFIAAPSEKESPETEGVSKIAFRFFKIKFFEARGKLTFSKRFFLDFSNSKYQIPNKDLPSSK
ncbi:MAG: hypothetical protein DBX55_01425 [Verrucomicrobia bacterium]|nr:MAG: hypothetical protein DBX55_01425 [Verrucomicrobiota bacterium]